MSRTITITLTLPDTAVLAIDGLDNESSQSNGGDGELSEEVVRRIRTFGRSTTQYQETYARWAAEEFGAHVVAADSGRPERINVYPPPDHPRRTRLAGLYASSARLAFPRLPESLASEYANVEVIQNRHQDGSITVAGVKLYLVSAEGVEVAKRLTELAFQSL